MTPVCVWGGGGGGGVQPSCRSLASKPPRREKGTQRNTNKHGHIPKRPQCKLPFRKVFCGDPMHTEGVYRRQTLQGKDTQVMGGQC